MALRLLAKKNLFNSAPNVRLLHLNSTLLKLTQFVLSDIGEGIREVTLREWFIKNGDNVAQFDNICLVESDKASVSITSRYDGVIKKLYYNVGDTALVGKPLVDIDTNDDEGTASIAPEASIPIEQKSQSVIEHKLGRDILNTYLATPAVRRIASEYNVSLKDVPGTGKAGRVMKEDILNYINNINEKPKLSVSEDKVVPLSGIKKVMVKTMTESGKIPTLYYYDEVNVTKLVEIRSDLKILAKQKGTSITFMPFFIKAMSKCIENFPEINSIVDEKCENMTIKHNHNIGIAVDSPKGLVVPNIKNVQNLTISQINRELNILMENGRSNKLLPADFSDGTISISNIGSIGGIFASPLINPPQVCILAIGKVRKIPLFDENDQIVKNHVCTLGWAADHRVIDGATVARFSNMFKEYMQNPLFLLME